MRITIVQGAFLPVPSLRGSAVENICLHLGQEFVRQGHEVVHISRKFPGLPDRETIEGVDHRRISGFDAPRSMVARKLFDLIYSLQVRRALPQADVILSNAFWFPAILRSKRFGRVFMRLGRPPRGQMWIYPRIHRLIAVSRSLAKQVVAQSPAWESRMAVLNNPLEPMCLIMPNPPEGNRFSSPWRLLFVGRIHPEKGLDLIMKAMARVGEDLLRGTVLTITGPHAVDALGGGAAYLKNLQEMAERLPCRVSFTGPVIDRTKLYALYRDASLFIYPSLPNSGETFGNSPLEAMAQGCPVLASSLECFQEYLVPGKNGLTFDVHAEDPAGELADRLRYYLSSDDVGHSSLSKHARETALNFSLQSIAKKYLDAFRDGVAAE